MPIFANKLVLISRALVMAGALCMTASLATADETVTVQTSIKNHRFQPAEIKVPANKPIVLVVKNLDPTPEEFESKMLRVEKIIVGGGEATIQIRPLNAGRYRFFGDYNESTAEGFLVVE